MENLQTEHGIFTNNEVTRQSAEEVYQEWLTNKDKPLKIPEIELLRIEQAKANAEIIELMMSMMFGGGM